MEGRNHATGRGKRNKDQIHRAYERKAIQEQEWQRKKSNRKEIPTDTIDRLQEGDTQTWDFRKGRYYNQSVNSQTLRRFSSKAQALGFQRVSKWASTDQYLMMDHKGKCWDKSKWKAQHISLCWKLTPAKASTEKAILSKLYSFLSFTIEYPRITQLCLQTDWTTCLQITPHALNRSLHP